jgi:DNA polymerase-3 subunit gamma/tau
MEMLTLKYRPATFDDLVGQPSVAVILKAMVLKDAVPTAILLDGVRGTGKTTSARILAAALNCEVQPGPCTKCPSCKAIADGTSLDVQEIDAASNGRVEDIRDLLQQVLYTVGGRKRVVLLDEAHSMSPQAFNVLLKTLEEPPPNTVFVLLTTEPSKILETVLSRCMSFTFRRISIADIVSRLEHICRSEGIQASRDLLISIAERADGGMRDAVMTLDQVSRVGVQTAEDFAALMGESDFAPVMLSAMTSGDMALTFQLINQQMERTGDASAVITQLVRCLTDLVKLKAGGEVTSQGDSLKARQSLANLLDSAQLFTAMRALWDLKTKIRADDVRTCLDLAAVVVAEALSKGAVSTKVEVPKPSGGRLSLADMRCFS